MDLPKTLTKQELANITGLDESKHSRIQLLKIAKERGLVDSYIFDNMTKSELADYLEISKNTITKYHQLVLASDIEEYQSCCLNEYARLSDFNPLNLYQISVLIWVRKTAIECRHKRGLILQKIQENKRMLNDRNFKQN